jgi:hypothetical protein
MGAMVAVFGHSPDGPRHLLLHRADVPLGEDGDWAWGSPSGVREPVADSFRIAVEAALGESS